MKFLFIRDSRHKYRYFLSEPVNQFHIEFSHWKALWEKAKKKLVLLPQKTLRQEQAFGRALKLDEKKIQIYHSGIFDEKKIKAKFNFFLQKQRTKHILLLAGEILLLPISGLAALLPGPNVFFGILALLIITHWNALKGINRMLKKEYDFNPSPLFKDWEQALESKKTDSFPQLLKKIEEEYDLDNIQKILWK